jgi:hypothetical protein
MAHLSAEVAEAANRLGFAVRRIPPAEAEALRRRIAFIYSLGPKYLLSYHYAENAESIHDRAAWSWLSDFLGRTEVYMLFNPDDDPDILRIPSGTMVVPLLKETTGFVFYLAPSDGSFLLCYDDHDCLIGLGTAGDWIRQGKHVGPQHPAPWLGENGSEGR